MGGRITKLWYRDDRGAALVEAAIVMPLLLMLTLGIWTTARAWNVHNVLDHAAREAARFGAVNQPFNPAEVLTVAQGEVTAASIDWTLITTTCTNLVPAVPSAAGDCIDDPAVDPTSDERVQVVLRYPNYQLDFIFFSINIDLQAQAVSRREPGL